MFQSPLLRGNGFDGREDDGRHADRQVSVPSSSGQRLRLAWSAAGTRRSTSFQSPLLRGNGFDPQQPVWMLVLRERVSVPSSSGQRLRRARGEVAADRCRKFQSPLLRGNGFDMVRCRRYPQDREDVSVPSSSGQRLRPPSMTAMTGETSPAFQSPLLRGNGFDLTKMDSAS